MATPAKGKRFVKMVRNPETGRTNKVSYVSASSYAAMKRGFKKK